MTVRLRPRSPSTARAGLPLPRGGNREVTPGSRPDRYDWRMSAFEQRYTLAFLDIDPSLDPNDATSATPHPGSSTIISAVPLPDGEDPDGPRVYRGTFDGQEVQVTVALNEQGQAAIVPGSLSWHAAPELLAGKVPVLRSGGLVLP